MWNHLSIFYSRFLDICKNSVIVSIYLNISEACMYPWWTHHGTCRTHSDLELSDWSRFSVDDGVSGERGAGAGHPQDSPPWYRGISPRTLPPQVRFILLRKCESIGKSPPPPGKGGDFIRCNWGRIKWKRNKKKMFQEDLSWRKLKLKGEVYLLKRSKSKGI